MKKVDVAIIGAGFGGIGTGIALKKRGLESFVIFEGEPGVGGSWRTNTYPGCACDVPSHLYSYSFEPNPDWAEAYSRGADIQRYIERCADKYGITPHVRFRTRVKSCEFDTASGRWRVTTDDGEVTEARVLVPATGILSHPRYPELEGMDSFAGKAVHAARWEADLDLTGKRVGVIGTGASAIQIVPSVARVAGELDVFQRTPSWVLPKRNRTFTPAQQRFWRTFPAFQLVLRWMIYWLMEAALPALMWFPRLLRIGEWLHRRQLEATIQDPVLREKLTPKYNVGCKRTLVSDDWFETFTRKNVHLHTDAVTRITPAGVLTVDGNEHPLDVLIYATGYKTAEPAYPFQVHGIRGQELKEYWGARPKAFFGMSVPGFPNMLIITGPNTGPGHTSVIVYQEAQYDYIARFTERLVRGDAKYYDVKEERVNRQWNEFQARMGNSTWLSGCTSWYLNADGTNSTMWPGFSFEYVLRLRSLHLDAYDAVLPDGAGAGVRSAAPTASATA